MKALRILVVVAVLFNAFLFVVPKSEAQAASPTKWVIYFDPHPDDEVLTFGVPILNDLRAGKKVKIVLFSYGENSSARDVINGKKYDSLQHKRHNPKKEGYKPMDKQTFGRERAKELVRAASALGVKDVDIYHLPNDNFTYQDVANIVQKYVKKYPDAEFKTMSKEDAHPDHAMIGKVVDDYYSKRIIKKKTNYLSIYTDRFAHKKVSGAYKVYLNNKRDKSKLQSAINEYKWWNPKKDRFAIGYHSVPSQFDSLQKNIYSKVVPY